MESLLDPIALGMTRLTYLKAKLQAGIKMILKAGFRMVPNSPVRKGSYIGKNVVLMPCFINTGAC